MRTGVGRRPGAASAEILSRAGTKRCLPAATTGGVPPSPDLVSRRTRREVRDLCTDIVYAAIRESFDDEGFVAGPEPEKESSVRRSAASSYLDVINWADQAAVRRALRVFEWLLRLHERSTGPDFEHVRGRVRDALRRDGFHIDADGVIYSAHLGTGLREASLANLSDASAIRLGLARVAREVDTDPHSAVGAAKELIDSTAKVVLHERGLPVDDGDKVPTLVKRASESLDLSPGPDAADAVSRILGGLTNIAVGTAELRSRGYGRGHGPRAAPVGLSPRHARLAVGAATVWCQLLLDTLEDSAAPWRRRQGPDSHRHPDVSERGLCNTPAHDDVAGRG